MRIVPRDCMWPRECRVISVTRRSVSLRISRELFGAHRIMLFGRPVAYVMPREVMPGERADEPGATGQEDRRSVAVAERLMLIPFQAPDPDMIRPMPDRMQTHCVNATDTYTAAYPQDFDGWLVVGLAPEGLLRAESGVPGPSQRLSRLPAIPNCQHAYEQAAAERFLEVERLAEQVKRAVWK